MGPNTMAWREQEMTEYNYLYCVNSQDFCRWMQLDDALKQMLSRYFHYSFYAFSDLYNYCSVRYSSQDIFRDDANRDWFASLGRQLITNLLVNADRVSWPSYRLASSIVVLSLSLYSRCQLLVALSEYSSFLSKASLEKALSTSMLHFMCPSMKYLY